MGTILWVRYGTPVFLVFVMCVYVCTVCVWGRFCGHRVAPPSSGNSDVWRSATQAVSGFAYTLTSKNKVFQSQSKGAPYESY